MGEQTTQAVKRLLEQYAVYEEAWQRHRYPPGYRGGHIDLTNETVEHYEFIRTMAVIDATMPTEVSDNGE